MKADEKVKKNKPFYKKWWFWAILVILIIFGIGNMSQPEAETGSTKSSDTSTSTNSEKASKDVEKAKDKLKSAFSNRSSNKGRITKKQYDAITLGDSQGSSQDAIKNEFGSPSSTSTTTVSGVQADQLTWNKVANGSIGSAVVVGFSNNVAISKGISGLKVTRKAKLGLDKFNSIQNGQSESDVIQILGDPNGYSESNISGLTSKTLIYTSGISGDIGANFNITISNGAVSGKSQTSLK